MGTLGAVKAQMDSEAEQHQRAKHPSGWEPGVVEEGDRAVAISAPTYDSSPAEEELIRGWQMDPAEWQIVGKVNCRRWQTYDERWLYYYKADLQRIDPLIHADAEALYKRIRGFKRLPKTFEGDFTFLALIGDTQIGKADGDGSPGTIDRWMASLDKTVQRLQLFRRAGIPIGSIALAWMGDLGEGCSGNYASQQFTTDLTMREQDGLLQELIWETHARFAPLTNLLYSIVVPGNHGEVRQDGKAFTLPSDNRDIAVVETVHRGIRRNENHAFDHVKFVYPTNQELTVAMDLSGVPCAFAHGHQFSGGATPTKKAEGWWKDQAHGKTACGDADILFSAHYHHLLVNQSGRKTHFQTPSLDGGSQWWENLKAQMSPPGMLSMVIGQNIGPANCGWDELKVA